MKLDDVLFWVNAPILWLEQFAWDYGPVPAGMLLLLFSLAAGALVVWLLRRLLT